MHGDSLGYTDGKVHGYDEGIKLGYTDGNVIVTIPGNVDGIILGLDVGTYLGSVNGSLMVLMMEILRGYFLEVHWGILRYLLCYNLLWILLL